VALQNEDEQELSQDAATNGGNRGWHPGSTLKKGRLAHGIASMQNSTPPVSKPVATWNAVFKIAEAVCTWPLDRALASVKLIHALGLLGVAVSAWMSSNQSCHGTDGKAEKAARSNSDPAEEPTDKREK
jgi:hypothetical protein